jgi:hypothetical protein
MHAAFIEVEVAQFEMAARFDVDQHHGLGWQGAGAFTMFSSEAAGKENVNIFGADGETARFSLVRTLIQQTDDVRAG